MLRSPPEAQNFGSRLLSCVTGRKPKAALFGRVSIWQMIFGSIVTSSCCKVVDKGPSGEAVSANKQIKHYFNY